MNARDIATDALLAAAASLVVLSAAGVYAMPTVFDRIHYLGPASTLAPVLVAAAVVLHEAYSPLGIKAIMVALLLVACGPVLAHATARAAAAHHRRDLLRGLEGGAVEDDR